MQNREFENLLEEAYGSAWRHYLDQDSWEHLYYNDVLSVSQKPHATGVNVINAELLIKRSSSEIQEYLHNMENWKDWHKQYKKSKVLEDLHHNSKIFYFCTKHISYLRGRELILASKKFAVKDHKFVIFTSVNYENAPGIFYKVRGWCYFFFFIIKQLNSVASTVTFLCQYDPRGVRINSFSEKITKKFVENLLELKKVMEKDHSPISLSF